MKLSKCVLARPQVKFIGNMVRPNDPLSDKAEAIRGIPEPHNKKLLRSFLGMCSFYREYILRYSDLALPLTELTKNRQPNSVRFGETKRAVFLK